jgi:hypothetical protein
MKNKNAGKMLENAGKCWKNSDKDFNLINPKNPKKSKNWIFGSAGKSARKCWKKCWKNPKNPKLDFFLLEK